MEGELERGMRQLGRRGRRAVVAAAVRGEERAFGSRALRARQVDQRSLFEIGSVTKAFTGLLLADMVLAGEAALHDPLSRHLPSPRPAWRYREPTLRELATHRSGLPNTPGLTRRREFAYAMGFGSHDPWAGLTRSDYERLVARDHHAVHRANASGTRAWRWGCSATHWPRAPARPTRSCSPSACCGRSGWMRPPSGSLRCWRPGS